MSFNVKNILAPEKLIYSAAAEPGTNAIATCSVLNEVERLSGFPQWVTDTAAALNAEQRERNVLIFDGMMDIFEYDKSWQSFEELIESLESKKPEWMANRVLTGCTRSRHGAYEDDPSLAMPTENELLEDEELYAEHMRRLHAKKEDKDLNFHIKIYKLLKSPRRLKALVVKHMREMWDQYLAAEWKRRQAEVKAAVAAFKNLELDELSPKEAIRAVLGRDLMKHQDDDFFVGVEQIAFVPSPHVGPYALVLRSGSVVKLIFGAQHAERFQGESSALSRSELLSRLSALSDPTRMQILELLMEQGEMNSQQVIAELDLSQSSASRHLIQLCASGFLVEKRVANSKYYAINRDRIDDTIELLSQHFDS